MKAAAASRPAEKPSAIAPGPDAGPPAPRAALPYTVTSAESPSAPPTCCMVCMSPEAAPAWSGRMPVRMRTLSGMKTRPTPKPLTASGTKSVVQ